MSTFSELVKKYVLGESSKLKKITEPLHRFLGSVYFTYHRIDTEGNYYALVDRPDWAEYYDHHALYLADPYLCHPDHYQTGISLWAETFSSPELSTTFAEMKALFGFEQGLLLIQKQQKSVEFFGVALPAGSQLVEHCLAELGILSSFCTHFKQENHLVIQDLLQNPVDLQGIKRESFFLAKKSSPLKKSNKECVLKAMGLHHLVSMAQTLSRREKEVLQLLCQGYSARMMGFQLKLSSRTIEQYVESAKNKLGCLQREELIRTGLKLQQLNELSH